MKGPDGENDNKPAVINNSINQIKANWHASCLNGSYINQQEVDNKLSEKMNVVLVYQII